MELKFSREITIKKKECNSNYKSISNILTVCNQTYVFMSHESTHFSHS